MKENIIKFKKSADDILEENKGIFDKLMILGYDPDGEIRVTFDGKLDDKDIIYLIECFKLFIINNQE